MNPYDLLYGLGLAVSAPVWAARRTSRRKVLFALNSRMAKELRSSTGTGLGILLHAVSLGEINATRALVAELRQRRPGARFLITTTTTTGWNRATQLYGDAADVTLLRFPLDFSAPIRRMLERFRPAVLVLMELEVWPNLMEHCRRLNIPVAVVNGRLTEASFHRYQLLGPVSRRMFGALSLITAQERTYAERFIALGVPPDRVIVTGTMKFDTARLAGGVAGAGELALAVGLKPGERVWVCGSTGPGEEAICLDIYRSLRERHPDLRLILVPRHPERFNEVAQLIVEKGFVLVRRSGAVAAPSDVNPVILGDTMGELNRFYSLARAVFVGRSLVDLGPRQQGSDMIEPAALGKPVAVGPFTGNFAEVVRALVGGDGLAVAPDAEGLRRIVADWLANPAAAMGMGARARQVVQRESGATTRNAERIDRLLPR